MPKVSVIVPNYRHAPYLHWRIDTILSQTFQDFELLILDDASPDNSREIIEQYRGRERVRILYNEVNSGSVFRQWEKGVNATESDYVWIAESDDWADPRFLERLVPVLDAHPKVGVAYCQSWLTDRESKINGDAVGWTGDLDAERWKKDFIGDGRDEIRRYLLAKNTIPNASAVLMRRSVLAGTPIDTSFQLCGDWMHWIRMLLNADVAYVAENLNFWRFQSSNARTFPPGVLEWEEGERILLWACDQLRLTDAERDRVLFAHLRRCWQWLKDAISARAMPPPPTKNIIPISDNVSPAAVIWNRLRAAPDHELLEIYVEERTLNPALAALLPKLPNDEIQSRFTGLSNRDAFQQAIAFLRVTRDFAQRNSIAFGTPAQRILDFGCGWGRITQVLLPFFEHDAIHGVDVMPSALSLCRESGLRVDLQQVEPWPPSKFPDAHFEYIVAYSVFSHLSEDNSFAWIREFARILKPGGVVAITTRYRDFFLYLQQLRQQKDRPGFSRGAARSFMNTEAVLAAYDRGEFCFDGEGKGGPGLTQTYGEAAIPQAYAEKTYAGFFQTIEFAPPVYQQHLDQAVILLRK